MQYELTQRTLTFKLVVGLLIKLYKSPVIKSYKPCKFKVKDNANNDSNPF